MSNIPEPMAEVAPPAAPPPAAPARPWITMAAMAACIVIFLGLLAGRDYSDEATAKFGYLSADEIFSGRYWSLFTSVFVHFDAIHLAFNLNWLWLLGSRMEAAIGWRRFMAFFIAAPSSVQRCSLPVQMTPASVLRAWCTPSLAS